MWPGKDCDEFRFGEYRLVNRERQLYRSNEAISLGEKATHLLALLVSAAGELMSTDVLRHEVWGDTSVVGGNIHTQINKVRNTLKDNKSHPKYIKTVHGTGYIFVGAVERVKLTAGRVESVSEPLDDQPAVLRLAAEVRTWLRLAGHEVITCTPAMPGVVELLATRTVPIPPRVHQYKILVRCQEGEADQSKVVALREAVAGRQTDVGWLVVDTRIARHLRNSDGGDARIAVFTIKDLINSVLGIDNYANLINGLIHRSQMDRRGYYVDLGCLRPVYDQDGFPSFDTADGHTLVSDHYESAHDYITMWLSERSRRQMAVLGDYGTGKTWFARMLVYRLLERYRHDPTHTRFPLLIPLKEYSRTEDLRQLFTDLLVNQYGVTIAASGVFDAFAELNARGRLLLVFDGFDEMSIQGDPAVTARNWRAIADFVSFHSKVIVTCRTGYFKNVMEELEVLGTNSPATAQPTPFEVIYLEEFSDDQIRSLLRARLKSRWRDYYDRIINTYDLPQLAHRPILLDMIINTLPHIDTSKEVTHARLYETYTDQWIERDISTARTLLDSKAKRLSSQEIAWDMFRRGELSIDVRGLQRLATTYIAPLLAGGLDSTYFEHDLRTASFISARDSSGHYHFIHRSFMEFFVAQKLAGAVNELSPSVFGEKAVYYQILRFLDQMVGLSDRRQIMTWLEAAVGNDTAQENFVRLAGQWVDESVITLLLKLATSGDRVTAVRRDAIRSLCRIFFGEEADRHRPQTDRRRLQLSVIRTNRQTLAVECLPIDVDLNAAMKVRLSDGHQRLYSRHEAAFKNTLLGILRTSSEHTELRVNASFALSYLSDRVPTRIVERLLEREENVHVRFNLSSSLTRAAVPLGRRVLTELSESETGAIRTMALANLKATRVSH